MAPSMNTSLRFDHLILGSYISTMMCCPLETSVNRSVEEKPCSDLNL